MKNFNSPMDAGLDTGVMVTDMPLPGRDKKFKSKGKIRDPKIAMFGAMDARATTSIGNCVNWLNGGGQREDVQPYPESVQEKKMRLAAEKRARRAQKSQLQ